MDAFYHAASQLPGAVSQALMRIPPRWAGDITEIRLRSGRPVSLSTPSGARFVSIDGGWREKPDTGVLSTPHTLVQNCFQAICGYSVHSFADCIANGFGSAAGRAQGGRVRYGIRGWQRNLYAQKYHVHQSARGSHGLVCLRRRSASAAVRTRRGAADRGCAGQPAKRR